MKMGKTSLMLLSVLILVCVTTLHAGAQSFVLGKVADFNTPIPDGSGSFANFTVNAVISGNNVAFRGEGSSGQEGIYVYKGSTLSKVVDLNTPVPGGVGDFTFFNTPVISSGNVAFWGNWGAGQQGIYLFDGIILSKVADFNTPIPSGSGNFTQFSVDPLISGVNVLFRGVGGFGAQSGVYLFNGAILIKVVDINTPIPGGSGNFTQISLDPVISGDNVAFRGEGASGQEGIYLFKGSTLSKVADLNTPIPDGSGNFFFFPNNIGVISISDGNVVFLGSGSSGQQGIYLYNGTTLRKVADRNTPIPGGTENFNGLGSPVIDGIDIDFIGSTTSGQQGIYRFDGTTLSKVVDPNTPIPGGTGNFLGFILPAFGGANVAFIGGGTSGQRGIYFFDGATLNKVADLNTPVPGGSGNFSFFEPPVISGLNVAFMGGQQSPLQAGIYLASSQPQSQTVSVPTFSEWGVFMLSLLLGANAINLIRRKNIG